MASTPQFTAVVNVGVYTFDFTDGTSTKVVFTAGSNGSRIHNFFASNTKQGQSVIHVYLRIAGTLHLLDTVALPPATSSVPVRHTNLLDFSYYKWLNGQSELFLPSGATIEVAMGNALTSTDTVILYAIGGNF